MFAYNDIPLARGQATSIELLVQRLITASSRRHHGHLLHRPTPVEKEKPHLTEERIVEASRSVKALEGQNVSGNHKLRVDYVCEKSGQKG